MRHGLVIFPSDTTLQPVELGRAAEDLGFESIWFPEHSHIPTSRITPAGGRPDADPLPEWYWRSHDQFLALAAIAAVTTNVRLGTGITLMAQRDPIWTAKQVASLDHISGGRVEFGIGYGWNVEEMANHGTEYRTRRALLRENVLAMKEIWANDEAEFHGDHVDFDSIWSWPKPVQQPNPPITLGAGAGPKSFAHLAEFCDGWIPIRGRHPLEEGLAMMREELPKQGRDPDEIVISLFQAKAEIADELEEKGVHRAIYWLPQGPPEEVLQFMKDLAPKVL